MSSVNVSVNDRAYEVYKRKLQRNGESFSQTLIRLGEAKDITRCFGLLKDEDDATWKAVFDEMERVRKYPLRGVVK
jgi:predicted CopG family antitoxin